MPHYNDGAELSVPIWEAMLLGVVQGLTEFLPVSSSGHLAIAQLLLPAFRQPGLVFDVALHLGTVVSVLVLELDRIVEAFRGRYALRLGAQLFVATCATAAIAMPLRHQAEAAVAEPLVVALGFVVTAVLLLAMPRRAGGSEAGATPWWSVIVIGLAQGVAVAPGLSRSGTTIAVGAMARLERRWAADFSFLLCVPAVLGAAVVEGWSYRAQIVADAAELLWPCLVGGLVAALVGMAAIGVVRRMVRHGRLHVFAYYLIPLAIVVAAVALFGGG